MTFEEYRFYQGEPITDIPVRTIPRTFENWREYWIIDPNREQVWILSNPEGQQGYDRVEYTRGQSFSSVQFRELVLSVDTVLCPPLLGYGHRLNSIRMQSDKGPIAHKKKPIAHKKGRSVGC